jgi:hypothetical protein
MEIKYLSILLFVLLTIVYYIFPAVGKIPITVDTINNDEAFSEIRTSNYSRVGVYFAAILLSQYILNAIFIVNRCGGNTTSNFTNAFLITFMPWIFIFGVVIIVLIIFPGFKGAFSDIIGYFIVAGMANDALSKILKDKQIDSEISKTIVAADFEKPDVSDLRKTAESLMKFYSNKAILINQIVPDNFVKTWQTLKPLMKDEDTFMNLELKQQLLDVVILRDNIGEALWYLYTAIVIISIISYNLSNQDCIENIYDIEIESRKRKKEYQKSLQTQQNDVTTGSTP